MFKFKVQKRKSQTGTSELYVPQIQSADKEVLVKVKPNKIGFIWKFLFLSFFGAVISFGAINYYLYFVRRIVIVNEREEINQINVDDKSKEEAERLNLSQVKRLNLDPKNSTEKIELKDSYIIDSNGNVTGQKTEGKEIIYLTRDLSTPIDYSKINISDLVLKIKDIYIQGEYTSIAFDAEILANTAEFYTLITTLRNEVKNFKLIIELWPRWGDTPNYPLYASFSTNFGLKMNWELLAKNVEEIWIRLFYLTPPRAILPGFITTTEWSEMVIQYFLASGFRPEQIVGVINTKGLIWPDRYIAMTFAENHLHANTDQAVIISAADISNLSITATLLENKDKDNIYSLTYNGVPSILVAPSLTLNQKIIEQLATFGISCYILR